MSKVLKKEACPNCRSKGRDHSGDNLVVYEGGGAHCFTKETRVITDKGVLPISEILNKKIKIVNGNSEWEEVVFKSYGFQKIWHLNLTRNSVIKTIRTTSDHLWFTKSRQNPVKTKELIPNQYLTNKDIPKLDLKLINEGIVHGFIFGDGVLHHRKNSSTVIFYTEEKERVLKYFEKLPNLNSISTVKIKGEIKKIASVKHTNFNYKKLPALDSDKNYLYSFLVGYFAADGNLFNTSCSLSSCTREHLEFVKDICLKIGIRTQDICLYTRPPGKTYLKNKISNLYQLRFIVSDLPNNFFIRGNHKKPSRTHEYLSWKVIDVSETDTVEEVFCCETSTKSFLLEDYILTHNCFSCNFTILSEEYKLEHGLLNQIYEHEEEGGVLEFQESWERIKNKTRTEGKGYRGIDDETYAKFSVRHEYKTLLQGGVETEELVAQYYPLTATIDDNLQVCGVKVRSLPKKFRAEGLNKANITHLFGQANYLTSLSKTVVLCSGEIDMLSTYQMLRDLNQQAPAIMSITVGENGVEQYQTHYEYLNKFEKIVIIPDNDLPGKKALKEAVKCLPKDKVYVLEIPELYKDPNDMLIAGKEADFATLYFRAKPYVPDGIVGSSELFQSLLDTIEVEKIPLPPFLFELQEMLSGGLTLESIVNIAAASGIG